MIIVPTLIEEVFALEESGDITENMHGGIVWGGTAAPVEPHTMTGGIQWGGSCEFSHTMPAMEGGIVWGGSAPGSIEGETTYEMTGGIVWGGTAPPVAPHTMTGGIVWGGSVTPAHYPPVSYPMSGGIEWGGDVLPQHTCTQPAMNGGIVWGGSVIPTHIGPFVQQMNGGIVWGGWPFNKRRRIRIPADTTTEDLNSFPLFVYHRDLEDKAEVYFEDSSYRALPYEQRDNGTYVVRVDVDADANTDIYVNYNEE